MEVEAGRFPGKDDVGQGRRASTLRKDAEAGQQKSRLSAQLDLTLGKEASPASAVGSRSHGELECKLDLDVKSRTSMWGGCMNEWADRRQRTGRLVHTGRRPE